MSFDSKTLYALLPAVYRIRGADQGEPLQALLSVIGNQIAVLEENLAQLYDDQFIETCADWIVPYIGDLIGYRTLHGVAPKINSPRADVANTIGYRRRKCTPVMLQQLAQDVTGWPAHVMECFQRLATTQYMNHVRPDNLSSPDLRQWEPLERINSPFDILSHTVDVRHIASGRGRYNIPNIAIFLWRLSGYSLTEAQPFKVDERRYLFSPLGNDTPLFTLPVSQGEFAGLSTRMNVPDPISRRTLDTYLSDYYGVGKSLLLREDGYEIETDEVVVCNLSDTESGDWAHKPSKKTGIDPVLGRIAFPLDSPPPASPRVVYHYGFSADMGGGEYDRSASIPAYFLKGVQWQIGVSSRLSPVPNELVANLLEAVQAWNAQPPGTTGVIAIMDSGSYFDNLVGASAILVPEGSRLLIVGADWPEVTNAIGEKRRLVGQFDASNCRPHLRGDIVVRGTAPAGGSGGEMFLNGVLIEGSLSVSEGELQTLSFRHCTLVPGLGLSRNGLPKCPFEPSLTVRSSNTAVELDLSVIGGLRLAETSSTTATNSIVDATSRCGVAFSGLDGYGPGGRLHIEKTTVIGKVHASLIDLATNTIFFSHLAAFDAWPAPVLCDQRQRGCIRFSFVPARSRTPRRYRCPPLTPEDAPRVIPDFTSLRYGDPSYAQLSRFCPSEISAGADDENEMGAYHDLFGQQRNGNLLVRLAEYLRFGLEAGIFFEPEIESRVLKMVLPYGYGVHSCPRVAGGEPLVEEAIALPGIGGGLI